MKMGLNFWELGIFIDKYVRVKARDFCLNSWVQGLGGNIKLSCPRISLIP